MGGKVYFPPKHPLRGNLSRETLNTESGRSRIEWTAKENRLSASHSATSLCSHATDHSHRKLLEHWMKQTDFQPRPYAEVANFRRGVPRGRW